MKRYNDNTINKKYIVFFSQLMLLLKNEWQQKKKLVLNINAKEIFFYGRFQGKGIFFFIIVNSWFLYGG